LTGTAVQCPYCGSFATIRESGPSDWVWRVAAAASLFMRLLLSPARYGAYRGEPGPYRCTSCGRGFIFFM
jgi:DNA-directed RNA polymerase subunit RPC12/RpoP